LVKRGRGLGHVTYFSNFANISGTAEDTNQKCSRATSKYHDLLNKQATEALELGKIRKCIALTFNTVTKCGLGLLTSWTKKSKNYFQKLNISLTL